MNSKDKLSICQVKLNLVKSIKSGELSDDIFRKCQFCEKNCHFSPQKMSLVQKLSGPDNFYCDFCIRHNLHTRANRDTLILSFRSIVGYLYYQNYLNGVDKNKLWVSQIQDLIDSHQQTGYANPLFLYDSESLLWFIDFSKVGTSKKKISIDDVLKTIISILTCFNLSSTIPCINTVSLYQKYKTAIDAFYSKRHRPENRRLLIPTLTGCGLIEPKNFSFDRTRNFIFENLELKS